MPDTFYRGAGRIARFRSEPATPKDRPEDWVASTTSRAGHAPDGMTRLAGGAFLAAVVGDDPVGWLGREHVARYGPETGLLVKLLDAGQRLPLHVHPDRGFAAEHLASPYGKTEAWIVLEAEPGAVMHLGFSRDVAAAELSGWVRGQDIDSMLAATNKVPVAAGDTVLCPAGAPHAIDAGILLVELQEPTDLSLVLELRGFPLDPAEATLGLPLEEVLGCVNRRAYSPEQVGALRGRSLSQATGSLLPAEADPFFVAERVGAGRLTASFSVLVVTSGTGTLSAETGAPIPVRHGSTVVIPYGAGACTLAGDVTAVRCLPAAA